MRVTKMEQKDFKVINANECHVSDICNLLISSITELCSPDYDDDPAVMKDWLANKTPENILKWVHPPNNSYVVIDITNTVVGFALINQAGEILLNYVAPNKIHQGIGKTLLNKMEDDARHLGLAEITVMSTITAKTFYKNNGFVENGNPEYISHLACEFPLKKKIA